MGSFPQASSPHPASSHHPHRSFLRCCHPASPPNQSENPLALPQPWPQPNFSRPSLFWAGAPTPQAKASFQQPSCFYVLWVRLPPNISSLFSLLTIQAQAQFFSLPSPFNFAICRVQSKPRGQNISTTVSTASFLSFLRISLVSVFVSDPASQSQVFGPPDSA